MAQALQNAILIAFGTFVLTIIVLLGIDIIKSWFKKPS